MFEMGYPFDVATGLVLDRQTSRESIQQRPPSPPGRCASALRRERIRDRRRAFLTVQPPTYGYVRRPAGPRRRGRPRGALERRQVHADARADGPRLLDRRQARSHPPTEPLRLGQRELHVHGPARVRVHVWRRRGAPRGDQNEHRPLSRGERRLDSGGRRRDGRESRRHHRPPRRAREHPHDGRCSAS